jgi:hypothetical protein
LAQVQDGVGEEESFEDVLNEFILLEMHIEDVVLPTELAQPSRGQDIMPSSLQEESDEELLSGQGSMHPRRRYSSWIERRARIGTVGMVVMVHKPSPQVLGSSIQECVEDSPLRILKNDSWDDPWGVPTSYRTRPGHQLW